MAEIISLGRMAKSYLVKEGNTSILVDTGFSFDKNSIYNSIKNENINDEEVSLIILTHGHSDHIGNVDFFSKKFDAPIAMNKFDYPMISENITPKLYPNDFFGRILSIGTKLTSNSNKLNNFKVDYFTENKDSIEKYGVESIDAIIYNLPGHTKGSIGLMVDGDKFIVGDAMMNHFSPRPASIFENKEDMLKSVEFIRNSDATMIYSGHGKPFENK